MNEIYFSDKVELFQPKTATRESKSCKLPNLPQNRTEPTVNVVDGSLVVCGGDGGEHACLQLQETGQVGGDELKNSYGYKQKIIQRYKYTRLQKVKYLFSEILNLTVSMATFQIFS